MASRILHLAVAEEIMKQVNIKDKNRFRLGCILPDAYNSKADSHLKMFVCGNSKRTYDLNKFITFFKNEMKEDELYIGYYLHLIQDLIFRELLYGKYKYDSTISGSVQRLHNDYHLTNLYAIKKYGVSNHVYMVSNLKKEKLFSLYPFEVEGFLLDMQNDFYDNCDGDIYFFTEDMADEFIEKATEACIKELNEMAKGRHYIKAYEYAWLHKPFSLLSTTQNTRDLGGYMTKEGTLTKEESILRSDIQNSPNIFPSEEDFEYLRTREITTIIDMREKKAVDRKPSIFAGKEDFMYFNFQINEWSDVPKSMDEVPKIYMDIASSKTMTEVFRCIANAKAGVMFNCTAGKDRTGVVAAILLLHAGVSDSDIIENYVLTKEYGKQRLELVHKNFPKLDMSIVTPCEMFMEEFLRMFREKYRDTENYFKALGLNNKEISLIREKLCKNY